MSNILKVSNRYKRTTSGTSFVNFRHIFYFIVNIAKFKQINSGWTAVSDNKFVFSNM